MRNRSAKAAFKSDEGCYRENSPYFLREYSVRYKKTIVSPNGIRTKIHSRDRLTPQQLNNTAQVIGKIATAFEKFRVERGYLYSTERRAIHIVFTGFIAYRTAGKAEICVTHHFTRMVGFVVVTEEHAFRQGSVILAHELTHVYHAFLTKGWYSALKGINEGFAEYFRYLDVSPCLADAAQGLKDGPFPLDVIFHAAQDDPVANREHIYHSGYLFTWCAIAGGIVDSETYYHMLSLRERLDPSDGMRKIPDVSRYIETYQASFNQCFTELMQTCGVKWLESNSTQPIQTFTTTTAVANLPVAMQHIVVQLRTFESEYPSPTTALSTALILPGSLLGRYCKEAGIGVLQGAALFMSRQLAKWIKQQECFKPNAKYQRWVLEVGVPEYMMLAFFSATINVLRFFPHQPEYAFSHQRVGIYFGANIASSILMKGLLNLVHFCCGAKQNLINYFDLLYLLYPVLTLWLGPSAQENWGLTVEYILNVVVAMLTVLGLEYLSEKYGQAAVLCNESSESVANPIDPLSMKMEQNTAAARNFSEANTANEVASLAKNSKASIDRASAGFFKNDSSSRTVNQPKFTQTTLSTACNVSVSY